MAAVDDMDGAVSPRQKTSPLEQAIQSLGTMNNGLDSLDLRADPDAQATVTDFLDFTEYLPSDMIRSLTLIGDLDKGYVDASAKVHELTTTWGQLPNLPPEERRPTPVQLRAEISENLDFAVSSRVYAHAEAARMAENVGRHYNRLKTIHAKLKAMLENFPTEEEQKNEAKSPQATRNPKITLRLSSGDQPKPRRPRVPRITVPGEVLAPYEVDYEACSDDSGSSIEDDDEDDAARRTPGPPRAGQPKTRVTIKNPKTPKQRAPKHLDGSFSTPGGAITPGTSASSALKQLKPPPEDAVPGSEDAPWMQLTAYELARLRKRMKKNSAWVPSETMIARELKNLGRGWDAFNAAKKKAEEEGKPFDSTLPAHVVETPSGAVPPMGTLTIDAAKALEDGNRINRGSELNKAKKLKREALAKLAAEEAEASARRMAEAAAKFLHGGNASNQPPAEQTPSKPPVKTRQKKRKRESVPEADAEKPEIGESASGSSQRPRPKRTKTETPVPVPVPQLSQGASSSSLQEPHAPMRQLTPGGTPVVAHSTTPVPVPIPGSQEQYPSANGKASVSPTGTNGAGTLTTNVPVKPPSETPIPPPVVAPTPVPMRETRSREARREQAAKEKATAPAIKQSASRAASPLPATPAPEPLRRPTSRGKPVTPAPETSRRPGSRGTATSQEPQSSLAVERSRRASTARNTPAPEARQPSKRVKRPAPGVISRTNSGGNSAVGKRKAAPKKKSRQKKDKGQAVETEVEVEVDDEGNVIDAEEPRYCLCNRVSYGTMIQCDNGDCKQEWFHLECVGLSAIPARTTKWYCPECRVALNIGEKGEVSARGVRA